MEEEEYIKAENSGIINRNQKCYIIAPLQLIFHATDIVDEILKYNVNKITDNNVAKITIDGLQKIFTFMRKSKESGKLKPEPLKLEDIKVIQIQNKSVYEYLRERIGIKDFRFGDAGEIFNNITSCLIDYSCFCELFGHLNISVLYVNQI